ncbi:GPO family capsid scaffolding protein [Novosphingobium sp.]|uniref:GPO family capsid scaffolding protein n=1 Tax=Novosphingobium sp. TaxID=1874826 RepID=UPI001D70EA46|nr:GPO family capsid scaffolding protein [Novosphingobium sp.]MBX9661936.1 GPO family capsid scaffolding protein [Novosphingobium sp.]
MAKTRFFRVAVEGATTDGRAIDRQWLLDAAETYNRETYAARVNLEHVRGITADGPFQAYGDVLSLKTDTVELNVGGKPKKLLALFAEVDALDPLIAMNKKGQKLYSSVEIAPNFAGTGKAYLVGLAVTDSPASLGTEMLQFAASQGENNPLAHRKQDKANLFTAAEEVMIELAEETPPADPTTGLFAKISAFVDSLSGKPAEPKSPPAPPSPPAAAPEGEAATAAAFAQIGAVMTEMASTVKAFTEASQARTAALEAEVKTFRELLENTPANKFQQRAPATGGAPDTIKTDC